MKIFFIIIKAPLDCNPQQTDEYFFEFHAISDSKFGNFWILVFSHCTIEKVDENDFQTKNNQLFHDGQKNDMMWWSEQSNNFIGLIWNLIWAGTTLWENLSDRNNGFSLFLANILKFTSLWKKKIWKPIFEFQFRVKGWKKDSKLLNLWKKIEENKTGKFQK